MPFAPRALFAVLCIFAWVPPAGAQETSQDDCVPAEGGSGVCMLAADGTPTVLCVRPVAAGDAALVHFVSSATVDYVVSDDSLPLREESGFAYVESFFSVTGPLCLSLALASPQPVPVAVEVLLAAS